MTLCTRHTTAPSTIPQGKHLVGVLGLYWLQPYIMEDGSNSSTYYTCEKFHSNCKPTHSIMNFTPHLNVSDSCFTIDNVQKSRTYNFLAHFNIHEDRAKVCFSVICGGMSAHDHDKYYMVHFKVKVILSG